MGIIIFLCGCTNYRNITPEALKQAKRPVMIRFIGENGIGLVDADMNLYVYCKNTYIHIAIYKSNLKAGDVLIPSGIIYDKNEDD